MPVMIARFSPLGPAGPLPARFPPVALGSGDEGDTDLPPWPRWGGSNPDREEEIPAGVGEVDDEGLISIDEEELPTGASIMPQTGEASHSIFSGLGLALIAGGLALFKRRT